MVYNLKHLHYILSSNNLTPTASVWYLVCLIFAYRISLINLAVNVPKLPEIDNNANSSFKWKSCTVVTEQESVS